MEHRDEIELRRLQRLVNVTTDEADERWGPFGYEDEHGHDFEIGLAVLVEELGKVSRAHFKEQMARDPDVREQWRRELKTAFVKSHSILNRLYLDRVVSRQRED